MKSTQFREHPNIFFQGAHDGEDETTLQTSPDPCSMRGGMRLESMSDTFSDATSTPVPAV